MFPFIIAGSRLSVETADIQALKAGDVVCYPSIDGEIVAHRVIRMIERNGQKLFLIKGDSSKNGEEIPSSAIAYRVYRVEHRRFSYETDGVIGKIIAILAIAGSKQSSGFQDASRIATRFSKMSIALRQRLNQRIQSFISNLSAK